MVLTEIVRAKKSKGEVLVFRRGFKPAQFKEGKSDAEAGVQISTGARAIAAQSDGEKTSDDDGGFITETVNVFHWR